MDSKSTASTVKISCDKCFQELLPLIQRYLANSVKDPNDFRTINLGYYKCMYGREYGSETVTAPIPCAPALDSLEQKLEFQLRAAAYLQPLLDNSDVSDPKFTAGCNECLARLRPLTVKLLQDPLDSPTIETLSQGYYQCLYGREYGSNTSQGSNTSPGSNTSQGSNTSSKETSVWVYIGASLGGVVGLALLYYLVKLFRKQPAEQDSEPDSSD
jgi:hypothetical protein